MKPTKSLDFTKFSFNAGLLYKELLALGLTVTQVGNTNVVCARYKKHRELLIDIYSRLLSYPVGLLISDKWYTKQWLKRAGFPVAEGNFFEINDPSLLSYCQDCHFPIVIKPTTGSHGDGVYTDVRSMEEVHRILNRYRQFPIGNGYIIVEEEKPGHEYRLFVTKNGFFAAVKRSPASIVGNGKDSVLRLIQKENERRMNPRTTCLCELKMDEITFDYMEKNHLTLSQVPGAGERIFLRGNSNVSTGGNCFDCTDTVHATIKEFAFNVLHAFPNAAYIGIDVLTHDIASPYTKDALTICEVNPAPGLSLHMMPETGTPRNVARAIAELLFPEITK